MQELHLIIKGFVQGIGFRATVLNYAKKYSLLGYVKNLSDGTVEILAQGNKDALEHFLEEIQNQPGKAIIDSIKKDCRDISQNFINFSISY